jgi:hypothetical protein
MIVCTGWWSRLLRHYATKKNQLTCCRLVMKTFVVASSGLLKKTVGVVTITINSERRHTQCEKRLFLKSISAAMRWAPFWEQSTCFFCLEKYDYLALDKISLWGVTAVDNCCFGGVIALALTTLLKALGVCHQIVIIGLISEYSTTMSLNHVFV